MSDYFYSLEEIIKRLAQEARDFDDGNLALFIENFSSEENQ